jgi:hypothetical protein
MSLLTKIGRALARYLEKPGAGAIQPATCKPELLAGAVRVGDVILIDGSSRVSTAIKYLTQSTWSHAAMCIEDDSQSAQPCCDNVMLIEADVLEGVRIVPLTHYAHLHTRICRAQGINKEEVERAISFARSHVGHQYDMKHIFDLMRYLIQTPPVPSRWRRKMISLGSGDPTQAICSSLIAQIFQSIRYPILPDVAFEKTQLPNCQHCYDEVLHIRHHSLYVPRDFDISPYFNIIKPTLNEQFDPHQLAWSQYQQP